MKDGVIIYLECIIGIEPTWNVARWQEGVLVRRYGLFSNFETALARGAELSKVHKVPLLIRDSDGQLVAPKSDGVGICSRGRCFLFWEAWNKFPPSQWMLSSILDGRVADTFCIGADRKHAIEIATKVARALSFLLYTYGKDGMLVDLFERKRVAQGVTNQ